MKPLNGLALRMVFIVGVGIAIAWNFYVMAFYIGNFSVCITIYCQNGERSMSYYC